MKKIHIFDLDGTLVDSSHRYRTINDKIDLDYWRENSNKVMADKLLPLAKYFRKLKKDKNCVVIIATARVWCKKSDKFLKKYNLTPDYLVARMSNNDNRKGTDLKIDGIKKLDINGKFFIHEDNKDYLSGLMREFDAIGYFYPSNQGH